MSASITVVFNVWSGTDAYRFDLHLNSLLHETSDINNYLSLSKKALDGWEKYKFEKPDPNIFIDNGFSKVELNKEVRSNVHFLLAFDGVIPEEGHPIVQLFENWIHENGLIGKTIDGISIGVSGMRNIAKCFIETDYMCFKDDDDLGEPITKLYHQCQYLKSEFHMGENEKYTIPTNIYNNISELKRRMLTLQKRPVIAIIMSGVRIKNTWGSLENPFSTTPTPVDSSTMELVNRPSVTSMCSKIYSVESLRMIENSICCGSLEDARSHFLQILPQHCIWLFEKYKLRELRKGWITHDKKVMKWLRINVPLLEGESYSTYFEKYFKEDVSDSPFYVYVLPSGSYNTMSWSYNSVVAALEAIRWSNRQVHFTIRDLKLLKKVITSSIKTKLVRIDSVTSVKWLGKPSRDAMELVKHFEYLNNYKFLYWFGVVHNKGDWNRIIHSIIRIRDLIHSLPIVEYEGADVIRDRQIHPLTTMRVRYDGEWYMVNEHTDFEVDDDSDYTYRGDMSGGFFEVECDKNIFIILILSILILISTILYYFNESSSQLLTSHYNDHCGNE